MRGARVKQRPDRYGWVMEKKQVDQQGEVAGLREGEGSEDWKTATQPNPYWLGVSFFGWLAGWVNWV